MLIDLRRRERQRRTRLQGPKNQAQRMNHRGIGGGSHRQKEELQHHLQREILSLSRGQREGGRFQLLRVRRRTLQVTQHLCRMLCRAGGLSQSGRLQGWRVVGDGGSRKGDAFEGELVTLLLEQGGSKSWGFFIVVGDRRSGLGRVAAGSSDLCGQLSDLLVQAVVLDLHVGETRKEELVLLLHLDLLVLQLFHLQPLALT